MVRVIGSVYLQVIPKPFFWMPACAGMARQDGIFRHSRESGNPGFRAE